MLDNVEHLENSLIQHGPESDRIYVMKLAKEDRFTLPRKLDALASEQNYTKIFAKVPLWAVPSFEGEGYCKEAFIPDFYNGRTGVYFMCKYFDEDRRELSKEVRAKVKKNLNLAKQADPLDESLPEGLHMRELGEEDSSLLTSIYDKVFDHYPFPIFKENYIRETMNSHIRYFGVFDGDNLVAASSAEMDVEGQNVEMTDFATDPDATGQRLALHLLQAMEAEMRNIDMKLAFTIARAMSPGMNITFGRNGYSYGGTLINNTKIASGIESMNVWYKKL